MKHLLAVFFIFLFSHPLLAEDIKPSKSQYVNIQVAKERLNQTWTILGQIKENKIYILNDKFEFNIKELENPFSDDSKPAPPTEVKPTPTNLDIPSLNFIMSAEQTKKCDSLKEFQTFLNQLLIFKGLFYQMEITASSRKEATCVSRMAEQIIAKGFKVNVAFGDLPDSGIVARAYIDTKENAGKFDPLAVSRVRIVAQIGYGRKVLIPVLKNGYFIMSFDQLPPEMKISFEQNGSIIHEESLPTLPVWDLGDFEKELFGAPGGTIQIGQIDSLVVEEIPDSAIERALQKKLEYQNKYRWNISNHILLREISGSGLVESTYSQTVPLSIDARYSMTDRIQMKVDLIPEFAITEDTAPKTNFIAAGLLYWVTGHENRHFLDRAKYRYGIGMQGYYLMNRASQATSESAYLLSDLMGLALINRISYQPTTKWSFNLGYDLLPFPKSQVNESSLSTRQSIDLEYCLSFTKCVSIGYHQEAFSLDYIDLGELTFNIDDIAIGYRMAFE